MKKISILAVLANPKGTDQLRLAEEDRVLHECIQLSKYRDNFYLVVKHAATIHDLRRTLLEHEFQIIHFSGHGTTQGLAFENEVGEAHVVPPIALAQLLSTYSPPVESVILNACFSEDQGQLVSLGVPYTIAMTAAISDKAAIEFTRGYYDAVGAGKDIIFAFEEGCRAIKLSGLSNDAAPVFLKGTKISTNRDQIFISYSHKDKEWLDRLKIILKPLIKKGSLTTWDDSEIKVGTKWKTEIENAMSSAKVAVLLVTPNFLASDFISEYELPRLLNAAKMQELTLVWIAISGSMYKETEIAEFQAANDPFLPLDRLNPSQQNDTLVEICDKIKLAFING